MTINRMLVYITLTTVLVLGYVGGVVVLQALISALTGYHSQLAVVLSTLAVVALFNPMRHQIQTLINRRFHQNRNLTG